jgi:hypothetical protein
MKKNKLLEKIPSLILSLLVLGACSSVNNEVESISNEDIDVAAHIVTTSIVDDESGMINSLYDTFSNVSRDGISYGDKKFKTTPDQKNNDGRGSEKNYSYSYDPITGTHTLDYSRSIEKEKFSKSIDVNQAIIFTDLTDAFIEFPNQNKDSVETISYEGTKVGSLNGSSRSSNFSKSNNFDVTGVHKTSSTLSLNGTHNGSGSAQGITRDSIEASRTYDINITFENVIINKDTVKAYGLIENAITGTLTYSINMSKIIGSQVDEKTVEGTIDLNEDGTASMRFNNFPQVIKFSLGDGERKNGLKGND